MRFWIWGLRILGAVWFVYIVLDLPWGSLSLNTEQGLMIGGLIGRGLLYAAMQVSVVLGLAEVMSRQMRLEDRISHQNSESRRVSTPAEKPPVRRSIAPVAPNWPEIKPRSPEPEKDDGYEQRLARRGRYRLTRKASLNRGHIGAIAKDLVRDAKENPEGSSRERVSSKVRK